jgi:hypothetical protein
MSPGVFGTDVSLLFGISKISDELSCVITYHHGARLTTWAPLIDFPHTTKNLRGCIAAAEKKSDILVHRNAIS